MSGRKQRSEDPPHLSRQTQSEEDLLLLTSREIEVLEGEAKAIGVPVHLLASMILLFGNFERDSPSSNGLRFNERLGLMEVRALRALRQMETEEAMPEVVSVMTRFLDSARNMLQALR